MKLKQETEVRHRAGILKEARSLCLDTCRDVLARVEQTKRAVLAEFGPDLAPREHLLRLAVNEAEALAWQTDYPHLLFPALAVEKAQAVAAWHVQQQTLLRQPAALRLAA